MALRQAPITRIGSIDKQSIKCSWNPIKISHFHSHIGQNPQPILCSTIFGQAKAVPGWQATVWNQTELSSFRNGLKFHNASRASILCSKIFGQAKAVPGWQATILNQTELSSLRNGLDCNKWCSQGKVFNGCGDTSQPSHSGSLSNSILQLLSEGKAPVQIKANALNQAKLPPFRTGRNCNSSRALPGQVSQSVWQE